MQQYDLPRLVIAAPQGRSGKTTVTIGLLAALIDRGLRVQCFKKGPDFIDPGWHYRLTGRVCRNLDGFLMDRETIRASFIKSALDADMSVVEGAMGLFDGVDVEGSGSTAEIARTIQAPVVLVINATRMTRSAAAVVYGCMNFEPGVNVAGVILNQVARPRHEDMLRASIERYCGVPVLGAVPKGNRFNIPDRHLGLIPAAEDDVLAEVIDEASRMVGRHLDVEGLIALARSAVPLQGPSVLEGYTAARSESSRSRVKIGVFMDRAFTFYYPENLEALQAEGADLCFINGIEDDGLPPGVHAVYIGGGFPEVFAGELEANERLREDLRLRVEGGLPVYAECGGLMYLGRRLYWKNRSWNMVGALPFDVSVSDKPQGHGYVVLEVSGKNSFLPLGAVIKGHEFHHSRVINLDRGRVDFAFRVHRGWGIDGERDGIVYKNVLAAYTHVHALTVREWAAGLVRMAVEYRDGAGQKA